MCRVRLISMVVFVALAVLAAPTVSAQALPCADAYSAIAWELISSIRSAGGPEVPTRIMELFVRLSINSVNRGNGSAALSQLQSVERFIDRSIDDPVTRESLMTLLDQTRAVLANCTATPPLSTLNCRSGDGENELLWVNPAGSHLSTTILVRTDRYPVGPSDPIADEVGTYAGGPGEIGRATHDTLANGMRYFYAAYATDSSGEPSPARFTFGRPQSRDGAFRWSFTTGGAGRPTIGGLEDQFMTTSSTGYVFALEPGPDGGTWPASYLPPKIPSPSDGRPITIPANITPDGAPWVLVTSRNGRVSAINASTGETVWVSPILGNGIDASVCAMFTAYGGVDDVVMVGVNNLFGGSRLVGLDFATGSLSWSFDNGGGRDAVGAIRNTCTVDYAQQRVYFTTETARWGSRDTIWALTLEDGMASKLWSENHPRINTAAVLVGEALYVGTDLGDVLSIDVADGRSRWTSPYSTGDGPVESFVFPQRGTGLLAFSTDNRVHLVLDTGTEASAVWRPGILLPEPNVPLIREDRVLVADADGAVYSIDTTAAQPTATPFAEFGDPARRAAPGQPYFDWRTGLYGVGTAEGVLYVVQTP